MIDDDDDDENEQMPRLYVYDLELICILCGRYVGSLQSSTPVPASDTLIPPSLRCRQPNCGGWPMYSGDTTRRFLPPVRLQERIA